MAPTEICVSVKGMLAPVSYTLIKREPTDAAAFSSELAALSDRSPPTPAPPADDVAPPATGDDPFADCGELGVDRETGKIVCKD